MPGSPQGHERSGLPQGTMTKYLTPETAGKFRLEFHHISAFGRFKGSFQDVLTFYRHIIGEDVQIVTALREPTQQYVSWVYFFQAPNHPKKEPMDVLRDFAAAKRNANPLCGEFGLYTQNDLDVFLETVRVTASLARRAVAACAQSPCVLTPPLPRCPFLSFTTAEPGLVPFGAAL